MVFDLFDSVQFIEYTFLKLTRMVQKYWFIRVILNILSDSFGSLVLCKLYCVRKFLLIIVEQDLYRPLVLIFKYC